MAFPSTLGGVGMAAVGSFPVGGSTDPLVPGIFLFLDGANVIGRLLAGSLEVTEELGGVKHMEYVDKNVPVFGYGEGGYGEGPYGGIGPHVGIGQRIILRQDTVNVFLGNVDRLEESLIRGAGAIFTDVEAVDLNAILERRLATVEEIYTNQLSGVIVRDLVDTYCTMEGLTTNSVQNGPTVADFTVEAFAPISKALRDLADRTGFVWFVDATGDLHFEVQTAVAAPFDIADVAGTGIVVPIDSIKVSESREQYRNRQTIRYGSSLALSVTSDDTAEQASRRAIEGGSGIYHAVEDASEIDVAAEATAFAQAKLRRFGKIPQTVRLSTRTKGFKPGQTVTITLPQHEVSGDFLIDQVMLRDEGAQILRWEVTALSGEHLADNMAFWRKAIADG